MSGETADRALPVGWVELGFTEVFDVQGGTQPPKSTFVYEPTPGYVQLLQIRDFGTRPVPTFIPDRKGLKKCEKEDILIARYGASLGRILTGLEGAYNVAMAKVDIPPEIDRRFTLFLLNSAAFQAPLMLVSRSAQNGFNKEDLAKFRLPFAPLAEQKRIADKLEAVLGRVDACRARLDRVPALLKRFRQSVLAAATIGSLTEEWRMANDVDDEWPKVVLRDVAEDFSYGTSAKSSKAGTVAVLRMGNIQDGKLDWEGLVYTSDAAEVAKYRLTKGDVLFNRTNSPELVGKTCVFDGKHEAIHAGYLIRVKCSERLLPDFLNYCLNSLRGRDYCWQVKTDGVSQSNINAKKLAAFPMRLPTVAEQREIVRRVEDLFAFADRIEARLATARKTVERLTPATLAKAFRGDLVPQDPADEPASALLERLRGSRGEASATKPKRGRRSIGTAP